MNLGWGFIRWGLGLFITGFLTGFIPILHYIPGAVAGDVGPGFLKNVTLWWGCPAVLAELTLKTGGLGMIAIGLCYLAAARQGAAPSVVSRHERLALTLCAYGLIAELVAAGAGYAIFNSDLAEFLFRAGPGRKESVARTPGHQHPRVRRRPLLRVRRNPESVEPTPMTRPPSALMSPLPWLLARRTLAGDRLGDRNPSSCALALFRRADDLPLSSFEGRRKRLKRTLLTTAFGLTLLVAVPAQAQLNGSHTPGDYGVQSGSQPSPGFYAALFYLRYDADTIKDADGNIVRPAPSSPGSLAVSAVAPLAWYVSKAKFLGANYGAMVVLPLANASIEAPAFALGETIGTSVSDLLVRPIDLGWHTARADVAAGLQLYAPTGRYEPGGSENIGKGMWTYEPFLGTTVYFDQKRTLSLAATAYWEIHGNKKDTDVKVGQILTLQGGLGKSFLGGGLIVGAAYYAQWKLTEDQLAEFELPGRTPIDVTINGKHKVFGFGPDVTLPVASKSKLFALVNVRYLWESGARLKTEGQTLVVTATFPVPSVRLQ